MIVSAPTLSCKGYYLQRIISGLREPMNGFTHLIGAFLAVIGFALLISKSLHPINPWHIAAYSIYGTGMVLLYVTSTLFHWLPIKNEKTSTLRKLDHIMIFVYMATTYAPFCMIPFRGPFGWIMMVCICTITALGALFKIYWINTPRWLCITVYLCAGWFALVAIGPIIRTFQPEAVLWLLAGGISYSIGAIIYACQKPDPLPGILGFHEIFHIFVILGSGAHFLVVYRYIDM